MSNRNEKAVQENEIDDAPNNSQHSLPTELGEAETDDQRVDKDTAVKIDNQTFLDIIFREYYAFLFEPEKLESILQRREESFHYFLSIWDELSRVLSEFKVQNPNAELYPRQFARRLYISTASIHLDWTKFNWNFLQEGPPSLLAFEQAILGTHNFDFTPKNDVLSLFIKMFEYKISQPELDFKEVFEKLFPDYQTVGKSKGGLDISFPVDFLNAVLPYRVLKNEIPVVFESNPKTKMHWVHIRRVTYNPGTQLIKTRKELGKLIESEQFEKGWHIVGVSHLLADGGNLILRVLKQVSQISDQDVTEYQTIDVNALLNKQKTTLPEHLDLPTVLGSAMRTVVLSPRYLARYIIHGELPELGWAKYSTENLKPKNESSNQDPERSKDTYIQF